LARNKTFLGGEQGGRIDQHIERWKALAASGGDVEIRGFCWSACTLVTAYIPKERLCFSKTAMLAFHLARFSNGEPSIEGSRRMFNAYPKDIRAWLRAKGGLEKMPLQGYWLMFPSEARGPAASGIAELRRVHLRHRRDIEGPDDRQGLH
jgi:hypothetical protein